MGYEGDNLKSDSVSSNPKYIICPLPIDFCAIIGALLTEAITIAFSATIETEDKSDIGNAVLSHLRPFESVLLISDGNANAGSELGDIGLYAKNINSTINTLELNAKEDDVGVSVIGPSKVLSGISNDFFIHLNKIGKQSSISVTVKVDGKVELQETTKEDVLKINKQFSEGFHTIEAVIESNDYFSENNDFYKTVKSVARPKILLYTESDSPMYTLLNQQFTVDKKDYLDPDPGLKAKLEEYYAVIVNNIHAEKLENRIDGLTDYIADGDGMFVIGGRDSYNYGEYRLSEFETLLPVQIMKPGKKEGDINIVLVLDISGSTSASFGDSKTVDVEKALAVGVLQDLNPSNKLGVVAFNTQAHLVDAMSFVFEKLEIIDKVASLKDGGGDI
ncbi:hypothetical protein ACFLZN_02285 [Nanoarchaeota archaeon]